MLQLYLAFMVLIQGLFVFLIKKKTINLLQADVLEYYD